MRPLARIYSMWCSLRYERLNSDREDRLYQLVGDDRPYDVWIGGSHSKSRLGNVVLSDGWGDLTQEEREAVFLHEVGHDVDWISSFLPALSYVTVSILAIFHFSRWAWELAALFAAVLVLLFIPWRYIQEYRADRYAYKSGYEESLISILKKLEEEERWVDRITHPPAESRIKRVSEFERD